MGLAHSPSIVTNGLVLCLDAANRKSYPGSGTTWTDLSLNKHNGTLQNGPTFNAGNQGYISFDGVDDAIETVETKLSISNSLSLCAFVYHNSVGVGNAQRYVTIPSEIAVIRFQNYGTNQLAFYVKTLGTFRNVTVNNTINANTWYYIVGTWDGTTQLLYKNAELVGTNTPPAGTLNTLDGTYIVSSNGEGINGRIAVAKVYNRALSANEVLQNYNALKGRFGL